MKIVGKFRTNENNISETNSMSLLREIQASVMQEADIDVGRVLLKLRFLASHLGSDLLEEWIKYELDGYPEGIPVPNYRKMRVSYTGMFTNPNGGSLDNVPIPPALIKKYAGERWVTYEMREGIAEIDDLVRSGKNAKGGALQIEVSDLILLLQGKIYEAIALLVSSLSPRLWHCSSQFENDYLI